MGTYGWVLLMHDINNPNSSPEVLRASENYEEEHIMKRDLHSWAYLIAYEHTDPGLKEEKEKSISDKTSILRR